MKVAIMTRHAIINYGSLLQAYATQKIVEKLGYDCKIIDYIRNDESYREYEKTTLKNKPAWHRNPLKKYFYLALRQPESIIAGKKFEIERKSLLNLTKKYSSAKELKSNPPIADVYVTGSDQVWGPVVNGEYDDSYCLSFAKGKKISYAASFGRTIMNEEISNYYKKWLSKYDYLSVREASAVELLKTYGLTSEQVLDPTLLFDSTFWEQLASPIKEKKYVLVYQLHNDIKLGEYANKVAKSKGLPLLRVSASLHQVLRPGKFIYCPTVGEFLSYIKNADCMITDSFHGTAFALNFNTQFVEVLPHNNTTTRNMNILSLTNLTDRILRNVDDTEIAEKEIDFTYANQVISKNREASIRTLYRMLK